MASPRAPLYVQIQQFIADGIRSKRFEAGARLPSEPELARRFSTTRATVARALQQLAYEGTIERRSGSGTFVSEKRTYIDAVLGAGAQSQEGRMAASGAALSYRTLDWTEGNASEEEARRLATEVGTAVMRLERVRLMDGESMALEHRTLLREVAKDIQPAWLDVHTIQDILGRMLGIRIGDAHAVVRAASADARLATLFACRRGKPVLVREHVLLTARGEPLMCGETTYPQTFRIAYTHKRSE